MGGAGADAHHQEAAEGRDVPLIDQLEQDQIIGAFNRVRLSNEASMRSPRGEAAGRVYMVGKYKEYRKLVGVSQIKTHSGVPDLNMSQKRRKTLSMSSGQQPPTRELTLQKTNQRGKLISDAI